MARMQRNFAGIVDMGDLPTAMFVVDVNHEAIAVAESERCGIPTVRWSIRIPIQPRLNSRFRAMMTR
jgi:hypothetical protein